jgi:hypothetical protein
MTRLDNWAVFFPAGIRVIALPSWERPRLLLPDTTLMERAAASGFYPAFSLRGRIYHWLLRIKATLALGAKSSSLTQPQSISTFLGDVLPDARVRAVQVGMKGSARKCTLQLSDSRGEVIGYVKCADATLARERLQNEFTVLGSLPPGVGPIPLKYGSVTGLDVLVLGVVPGAPLRPLVPPSPAVRAFVRRLTGGEVHPLHAHPWVLAHRPPGTDMARFLDALGARAWPVAIRHGDFAPWNVIEDADGRLTAIDWEYGEQAGFPGLDLAQYVLQVTGLIRRWAPARARACAVSVLMSDEQDHLTQREASALVGIAAYEAYEHAAAEGHAPTDSAQVWRRAVWESAV